MLDKFDAWLGKTVFVPPIIKFCQVTRQSQFAASRLFWFIAALDGFYRADTLLASVIFGVLSLIMMITASLRADAPSRSSLWMRMIAFLLLVIDILAGVVVGVWAGVEFWFLVLIAEYAATIRTIPPLSNKEQRLVQARQAD